MEVVLIMAVSGLAVLTGFLIRMHLRLFDKIHNLRLEVCALRNRADRISDDLFVIHDAITEIKTGDAE